MGQNLVGHFATTRDAEAALSELRAAGFNQEDLDLIPQTESDEEAERVSALAQQAAEEDAAQGANVPKAVINAATQGAVGRGAFIIVRAHQDHLVQQAIAIMERGNANEIERRDAEFAPGDWQPIAEANAEPSAAPRGAARIYSASTD